MAWGAAMKAPTRWVLLRGLARESAHWGRFPEQLHAALGPGHAVRTLDLPGNGVRHAERSPHTVAGLVAACRASLLRDGGSGPVRLVALSLGGMVALEWARTAPAEVSGCVLLNTSLRGHSPAWQRLRAASALRLACALRPGMDVLAREQLVLDLTTCDPASHAGLARQWATIARERPVRAGNVLRQLLAAARYTAPAQPPAAPVLVMCSAADRLVSPACSRALARRWQLPLLEHPWAGHDLPLDDPAWVTQRLVAWAQAEVLVSS
jgi:pimeloyl-ACP methyl ester carboxylesterase